MLCEASIPWHLNMSFLDKSANFPVGPYAPHFVEGDFSKFDDVYQFGKSCEVVTIEIESVNTEALHKLENEGVSVYPQPNIIELIQDKGHQKQFYQDKSIPTSPFKLVNKESISEAFESGLITIPCVQKLRKGGYDGKGVQVVRNMDDVILDADSLFEELVNIEKEISVIVARNASGQIETFDTVEMVFDPIGNLVDYLLCPADIPENVNTEARELAIKVIESLGMVGLLAVEMFWTKDGEILINEVAPRPHNSGHHTIKNCNCSQYEQLLRCLIDAPLIEGKGNMPAMMINVLGASEGVGKPIYNNLDEVLSIPGIHFYSYGKAESRPFRKLGHFTITATDKDDLFKKADIVRTKFYVSCEK